MGRLVIVLLPSCLFLISIADVVTDVLIDDVFIVVTPQYFLCAASFWRGVWCIIDLYPDDLWKSAFSSLGLATIGLASFQTFIAHSQANGVSAADTAGGTGFDSGVVVGRQVRKVGQRRIRSMNTIMSGGGNRGGQQQKKKETNNNNSDTNEPSSSTTSNDVQQALQMEQYDDQQTSNENDNYCTCLPSPSLTMSGVYSHVVATGGLLACGLFASVLVPPATASIIRDTTWRRSS